MMKRFMKKIFAGVTVALMLFSSTDISNQLVNAEELQQEQDTIEQVEVNQTEAGAEFIDQEVIADEVENEENLGIIASGVDGGVTWSIDDEGLLVVNITGDLSYVPPYNDGAFVGWPWDKYSDSITSAKVSGKGLTQAQYMFNKSGSHFTNIDLSGFDTSKVTDMSNMFGFCYQLTELDVSGFDTRKVTDMSNMFGKAEYDGDNLKSAGCSATRRCPSSTASCTACCGRSATWFPFPPTSAESAGSRQCGGRTSCARSRRRRRRPWRPERYRCIAPRSGSARSRSSSSG